MKRAAVVMLAGLGLWLQGTLQPARAQGLIYNLPKDGAWVRFEGTLKQVEIRPEAPEGDILMDWIQHLTIKSVGSEKADFHGRQVPCRWLEIKVLTGKPSEAGVDPGRVGLRLYKVLVPEERVVGGTVDRGKIPFSFLDIVKGYRSIGGEVTQLPPGALQVVPMIAPVMHYDSIEPADAAIEEVQSPGGVVKARKFKAKRVVESPTTRTTSEAELWVAQGNTIPFGLVRWTIKTTLEKKDSTQPHSAFKAVTQSTSEMSAHEWGMGAKSELAGN